MPMFAPHTVQERFAQVKVQRKPGGTNVLAGLPKKEGREIKFAAEILAAANCRECAKCCEGFSFTRNDPNFESIMKGIKNERESFIVRKRGPMFSKNACFEVFVPVGQAGCGFLQGQMKAYSELQLLEALGQEGEGLMSCGIYANRPSVCKSYPFIWEIFNSEYRIGGADNSVVAIDPACPAMWEAACSGIGHFTGREIALLGEMGKDAPDSLLGSFAKSLLEIKRRVEAEGKQERIFVNEEGEEAYPFDFPSIIHTLRDY